MIHCEHNDVSLDLVEVFTSLTVEAVAEGEPDFAAAAA
jgi:hypothetical protein